MQEILIKLCSKQSRTSQNTTPSINDASLLSSKLVLGNWSDPGNSKVRSDGASTDDPNSPVVVLAVVSEANSEADTSEIASSTDETTEDTVRERMDVGNEGEVRTVGGIHEDSKTGDEAEHSRLVVGVQETNSEFEAAHCNTAEDDPSLLAPERTVGVLVDQIGDDTSEWAEEDVEETEHGSPATTAGLTELGEVLQIVRPEDGVDGQFTTERAGVWESESKSLEGEDNREEFSGGRSDDDFAFSSVDDGCVDIGLGVELLRLLLLRKVVGGRWGGDLEVLANVVTGGPGSCRGIFTEEENGHGNCSDDDEWNNEGHSPCNVSCQVLLRHQAVEDSWHDEAGQS